MPFTNSKVLPWVVSLPLRLAGLLWPLLTEVLSLLWWGIKAGGLSTLVTMTFIAMYGFLCFAPNTFVFSAKGYLAALILLATSSVVVLFRLDGTSAVPEMLWVHIGFGVAWLAAIWLVRPRSAVNPA